MPAHPRGGSDPLHSAPPPPPDSVPPAGPSSVPLGLEGAAAPEMAQDINAEEERRLRQGIAEESLLEREEEEPPEEAEPEPSGDLTCALCHELYVDAVATPCGHTFCAVCHLHLFHVRVVGDPPAPAARRTRACPLCRAPLALDQRTPADELQARARAAHPLRHAQHMGEAEATLQRLQQAPPEEYLALRTGNTHRLAAGAAATGANRHDWTFYVTLGSQEKDEGFIERVDVGLHPTFRPPMVQLSAPPFQVRRLGWGAFDVTAVVHFRPVWDLGRVTLRWRLRFDGDDSFMEVPLTVAPLPPPGPPAGEEGQGQASEAAAVFAIGGAWGVLLGIGRETYLTGESSSEDEDWQPAEHDGQAPSPA